MRCCSHLVKFEIVAGGESMSSNTSDSCSVLISTTTFWTIYNNPDIWQSSTLVRSIAEGTLLETAKYALGLVKYVTG